MNMSGYRSCLGVEGYSVSRSWLPFFPKFRRARTKTKRGLVDFTHTLLWANLSWSYGRQLLALYQSTLVVTRLL